jgi:hypothetical protein
MQTDEMWEDDPPSPSHYVDGAWGRTANPNSVDGELQNIAAFGAGLTRLSGPRRSAVQLVVLLILLGFAVGIGMTVVGIAANW